MIKIEIKQGKLSIDAVLSIEESREIVNILLENKDEFEVKTLMIHLATIVEAFEKQIEPNQTLC